MNILILGAGAMAQALFSKPDQDHHYYVYTPSGHRAKALAKKLEGTHCQDLNKLPQLDAIVLAFKPQQLDQCYRDFPPEVALISMLTGVSFETLEEKFPGRPLTRIMPNLPASVGSGVTLWITNSQNSFKDFSSLIPSSGSFFEVQSEDELNLLTLLSGSGPAFLYEWQRILLEWFDSQGAPEKSHEILLKTMEGAIKLWKEERQSLSELRDKVSSRGGVTEAALMGMEKFKLEEVLKKSLNQGYDRVCELQKRKDP